jgi:hypothetical protein
MKLFLKKVIRNILNNFGYRHGSEIEASVSKLMEAANVDIVELATNATTRANTLNGTGEKQLFDAEKARSTAMRYYQTRLSTAQGVEDEGNANLAEAERIRKAMANLGFTMPIGNNEKLDD